VEHNESPYGYTLRVFEDRLLRRIFGPKREEVAGDWRRMHNEEFHNSHASPDIIRLVKSRRIRWEEPCSAHEKNEKSTQNFSRKT
jgi:hypothetical protein